MPDKQCNLQQYVLTAIAARAYSEDYKYTCSYRTYTLVRVLSCKRGKSNPSPLSPQQDCPGSTGYTTMKTPHRNKGLGFTMAEREAFGLKGLLPPATLQLVSKEQRGADNNREKKRNVSKGNSS